MCPQPRDLVTNATTSSQATDSSTIRAWVDQLLEALARQWGEQRNTRSQVPCTDVAQWCRSQGAELVARWARAQMNPSERSAPPYPPNQAELFGHIYESLLSQLQFVKPTRDDCSLQWQESGDLDHSRRKAAGVFFTPQSVASVVIQETLEPQIARCLQSPQPEQALGALRIVDPACGAGHLLMGAVRQLADAWRSLPGPVPAAQTVSDALMGAVYGVDIDEHACRLSMALLELTATQETGAVPSRPPNITAGDALLGLTPAEIESGQLGPWLDWLPGDEACYRSTLKRLRRQQTSSDANSTSIWRSQQPWTPSAEDHCRADSLSLLWRTPKSTAAWFHALHSVNDHCSPAPTQLDKLDAPSVIHWNLAFPEVGVQGGFDVVISNPPYVDSERMTRSNRRYRARVAHRYECCQGNWDLFIPFVELAAQLTRPAGSYGLITPLKLFASEYAARAQKLMADDQVQAIHDLSAMKVFADANVAIAVSAIRRNGPSQAIRFTRWTAQGPGSTTSFLQVNLAHLPTGYWTLPLSLGNQSAALTELIANATCLGDLTTVSDGATTSEAYRIKQWLSESATAEPCTTVRLINTGTIDPFEMLWGKRPIRYLGRQIVHPVVSRETLSKHLPRRLAQADKAKVVVAGLARQLEAVVAPAGVLCGKSAMQVHSKRGSTCPFAIAAWLNSQASDALYKALFGATGLGKAVQVGRKRLERLPCPPARMLQPFAPDPKGQTLRFEEFEELHDSSRLSWIGQFFHQRRYAAEQISNAEYEALNSAAYEAMGHAAKELKILTQ